MGDSYEVEQIDWEKEISNKVTTPPPENPIKIVEEKNE